MQTAVGQQHSQPLWLIERLGRKSRQRASHLQRGDPANPAAAYTGNPNRHVADEAASGHSHFHASDATYGCSAVVTSTAADRCDDGTLIGIAHQSSLVGVEAIAEHLNSVSCASWRSGGGVGQLSLKGGLLLQQEVLKDARE